MTNVGHKVVEERMNNLPNSLVDAGDPVAHPHPSASQPSVDVIPISNGTSSSPAPCPSSSPSPPTPSPYSSSSSPSPRPPPSLDGGWGWAVVAASFVAHCVADGCAFSFGIFYMTLKDAFDESDAKTSLVGSIFAGVPLMAGPVASVVTNKYGCRWATMVGTGLAMAGYTASYFATSLDFLVLSLGLVSGLGFSLIYMSAIIVVAFYFEKKRALATGIAVSGTGVGTMIFAPACEALIAEFGWRGTFLIIAGVVAQTFVCGAVFRPNEGAEGFEGLSASSSESASSKGAEEVVIFVEAASNDAEMESSSKRRRIPSDSPTRLFLAPPEDLIHPRRSSSEDRYEAETASLGTPASIGTESVTTASASDVPSYFRSTRGVFDEALLRDVLETEPASSKGAADAVDRSDRIWRRFCQRMALAERQRAIDAEEERRRAFSMGEAEELLQGDRAASPCVESSRRARSRRRRGRGGADGFRRRAHTNEWRREFRRDNFYRGSLLRGRLISTSSSAVPFGAATVDLSPTPSLDARRRPGVISRLRRRVVAAFRGAGGTGASRRLLAEILDVSLFVCFGFVWFSASNFLLYAAYDIPYYYVPEFAVDELGVAAKRAPLLISVIGVVSTFGQVAFGWLGDLRGVDLLRLYAASLACCGGVVAVVPFLSSFAPLVALCSAFGFLVSANYSLAPVILVEIVSLDRLTNAYGLLMFVQGLANVIGPPFAGLLSDASGSHAASFYVAGGAIFVSGAMLFLLRPLAALCGGGGKSEGEEEGKRGAV